MIGGNVAFSELTPVEQLAIRISSLDTYDVIREILRKKITRSLIQTLINSQLDEGQDGLGNDLADIGNATGDPYSPKYKAIRQRFGLQTSVVDLKFTGELRRSIKAIATVDGIETDADYIKSGKDIRDRWGENLDKLNEQNFEVLSQFIQAEIIKKIRSLF